MGLNLEYNKTMKKKWINERGQASVEYVLMIAVVVLVSLSVFNKMKQYIVGNNSIRTTFLGKFSESFGENMSFKRFPFKK